MLGPKDRLKVLQTEYLTASARYSPDHPDVVRLKKEIAALRVETGDISASREIEAQLEDYRAQLASARKKYSAEHPDVKRLTRTVANLEADLKKVRTSKQTANTYSDEEPDNPAYIQIRAELESANLGLAAVKTKREVMRAKLAKFESKLGTAGGTRISRAGSRLRDDQLEVPGDHAEADGGADLTDIGDGAQG